MFITWYNQSLFVSLYSIGLATCVAGGEARIQRYTTELAQSAGKMMAKAFGTETVVPESLRNELDGVLFFRLFLKPCFLLLLWLIFW